MRKIKAKKDTYNILLLDDDKSIVQTLESIVDRCGYHSKSTTNPHEAIEMAKSEEFDMMILDYLMTPINADEVVEQIRKFDKELYILLLTGQAELAPPIETLKKLDIQGFFEKGDRIDQLTLMIESGIKSVKMVNELKRYNKDLNKILELTNRINILRPLNDIINEILNGVKEISNCDAAIVANLKYSEASIKIFGELKGKTEEEILNEMYASIEEKKSLEFGNIVAIPLIDSCKNTYGVIFIDGLDLANGSKEVLQLFVNHAAISLHSAELYNASVTDTLTKLYNRTFIETVFPVILENANRYNKDLCVLFLDIDDFKSINDTYGHLYGDEVLKQFANVLKTTTRKSDFCARFGGEEFIIILTNTPLDGAMIIAERIRERVQNIKVNDIKVTTSIGLTVNRNCDVKTIIKKADTALYNAKQTGKNIC